MKRLFLGIDTSNYTTSLALVDEAGNVRENLKRLLPVAEGERGLRQSEAVFAHLKNLPSLTEALRTAVSSVPGGTIAAIGVSASPRDCEGSYMPVFLCGVSHAELLGAALGVPVFRFSHQAGHVAAAAWSAGLPEEITSFFAFHVSGGTTEILSVDRKEPLLRIACLGGSADLHAGQVIDRVGVAMGMPFPAGPSMERAALAYHGKTHRRKPALEGLSCHLSGLENLAVSMREKGASVEETASFVLCHVGDALRALTDRLLETVGQRPVLYAGGVMSCSLIKTILKRDGAWFAEPGFSSDNAAGIALLARKQLLTEGRKID